MNLQILSYLYHDNDNEIKMNILLANITGKGCDMQWIIQVTIIVDELNEHQEMHKVSGNNIMKDIVKNIRLNTCSIKVFETRSITLKKIKSISKCNGKIM